MEAECTIHEGDGRYCVALSASPRSLLPDVSGASRTTQDGADVGRGAGVGVDLGGSRSEVAQYGVSGLQVRQALLDLVQMRGDEAGDLPARGLAAVANGEDAGDLDQGKPGAFRIPDEPQPLHGFGRVVPVPAAGTRWHRQKSTPFVEADRLGTQAGRRREGADQHGVEVTLDLPPE